MKKHTLSNGEIEMRLNALETYIKHCENKDTSDLVKESLVEIINNLKQEIIERKGF